MKSFAVRISITSVYILTLSAMMNLAVMGCGDEDETTSNDIAETVIEVPPASGYDPQIDAADFTTEITNQYFTLAPGTTHIYELKTDEETERIEVQVTNETREVMGVETVVVWDRVWLDGELIEDTKDWFAQDSEGSVWYFGEESKDMEGGVVVSTAGSWEAGVDGAKPGIVMMALPKVGDAYRQEYYEGEAEDLGEVLALGERIEVPLGSYDDCLKTKDWNPLEPDAIENKYYCPAVGFVALEVDIDSGDRVELIEYSSE